MGNKEEWEGEEERRTGYEGEEGGCMVWYGRKSMQEKGRDR